MRKYLKQLLFDNKIARKLLFIIETNEVQASEFVGALFMIALGVYLFQVQVYEVILDGSALAGVLSHSHTVLGTMFVGLALYRIYALGNYKFTMRKNISFFMCFIWFFLSTVEIMDSPFSSESLVLPIITFNSAVSYLLLVSREIPWVSEYKAKIKSIEEDIKRYTRGS